MKKNISVAMLIAASFSAFGFEDVPYTIDTNSPEWNPKNLHIAAATLESGHTSSATYLVLECLRGQCPTNRSIRVFFWHGSGPTSSLPTNAILVLRHMRFRDGRIPPEDLESERLWYDCIGGDGYRGILPDCVATRSHLTTTPATNLYATARKDWLPLAEALALSHACILGLDKTDRTGSFKLSNAQRLTFGWLLQLDLLNANGDFVGRRWHVNIGDDRAQKSVSYEGALPDGTSTNASYGFTKENPIKIGDGPRGERRYLDQLRDSHFEPLSYGRLIGTDPRTVRMNITPTEPALQSAIAPDTATTGTLMADKETQGGISLDSAASPILTDEKGRKHELGDVVAEGGMGTIIDAWDRNLRRHIAMKILSKPKQAGKDYILRFIEEAQVTSPLEHPSVVPVHELAVDASGNVFYTMKFVKRHRTFSLSTFYTEAVVYRLQYRRRRSPEVVSCLESARELMRRRRLDDPNDLRLADANDFLRAQIQTHGESAIGTGAKLLLCVCLREKMPKCFAPWPGCRYRGLISAAWISPTFRR